MDAPGRVKAEHDLGVRQFSPILAKTQTVHATVIEPIAFDWVAHRWTHRIGDDEDAEYDYRDARHVCPIPAANDTVEARIERCVSHASRLSRTPDKLGYFAMTRIIAGTAGSLRLEVPKAGTRPTSDRVREAIFSSLESWNIIRGSRILDLYAGSGALGLEAISRGAASAVLVEKHPQSALVASRNAKTVQQAFRGAEVPSVTVARSSTPIRATRLPMPATIS